MNIIKTRMLVLWVVLMYCCVVNSVLSLKTVKRDTNVAENHLGSIPKNNTEVILHFLEDYKRLRAKKSEETMRTIATVGLVSGALKVEELIRVNLGELVDELIDKFNVSTPKENLDKLLAVEEVMERDRSSIEVLMSALQFARNAKTYEDFNEDMKRILLEVISEDMMISFYKHEYF